MPPFILFIIAGNGVCPIVGCPAILPAKAHGIIITDKRFSFNEIFRQTAFSFKRLYDSIKNYTATVIPYSLSQELMPRK